MMKKNSKNLFTCSSKRNFRLCVCSSNRSTYSRNSSISSLTCCTVSNSCLIATMSRFTWNFPFEKRKEECWSLKEEFVLEKCVGEKGTYLRYLTLTTFHGLRQFLQLCSNLTQGNCCFQVTVTPLEIIQF